METLEQGRADTLQIGVVYPQTELRGDPGLSGRSEQESRTWALTASSPGQAVHRAGISGGGEETRIRSG